VRSGDVAATREALHAVCEHVLAAALYAETRHIGLRVVPGGFATPAFGADDRVVTLGAERLTVTDHSGTRSGPYPTLRAAAQLVGIEPGLPAGIYSPATPLLPDSRLTVDPAAAAAIIDWYVKISEALSTFAPESRQTLWPEHFDVAIRRNECNFGGLAGDDTIADPYVYVGPPSTPAADPFFTEPFGAARTWSQAPSAALVEAFFAEGARRAAELAAAGGSTS
jgi:hypothetical protein